MVRKFEDLTVWKEAMNLAFEIYKSVNSLNDYVLKQQILRAAISIPSNVAEGFDRQTNKEFIQYLHIAKGSCAELRTQLYLSKKLELMEVGFIESSIEQTKKISAMLYNLIKTRKEKFK
jgi:four helix bundle protein